MILFVFILAQTPFPGNCRASLATQHCPSPQSSAELHVLAQDRACKINKQINTILYSRTCCFASLYNTLGSQKGKIKNKASKNLQEVFIHLYLSHFALLLTHNSNYFYKNILQKTQFCAMFNRKYFTTIFHYSFFFVTIGKFPRN